MKIETKIIKYSVYVRFIILMSTYILISISYEIITFNTSKSWRIISLIFTIWLIFCFIIMIILVFLLAVTFAGIPNDYHAAYEEFFRGIKPEIETRLYVFVQLIRKVYFVALLVIYPSIGTWALILMLSAYQLIYLTLLIYLRPFVLKKGNVIEFINESIFTVLLTSHFFIKSEEDWSTGFTNMYIAVIVANVIIIFAIISMDLLWILTRKIKKRCQGSNSEDGEIVIEIPVMKDEMPNHADGSRLKEEVKDEIKSEIKGIEKEQLQEEFKEEIQYDAKDEQLEHDIDDSKDYFRLRSYNLQSKIGLIKQ